MHACDIASLTQKAHPESESRQHPYSDFSFYDREDTHASFLASPHRSSHMFSLYSESSCGQSDKWGEEVLQASSITLQLAAFHCHLAPPV